jgi:hypothetical protein
VRCDMHEVLDGVVSSFSNSLYSVDSNKMLNL